MLVIDAARNVAYKNAVVAIAHCNSINDLYQTERVLRDHDRVVFYVRDGEGNEQGFTEPLHVVEWADGRPGVSIQVLDIQRQ